MDFESAEALLDLYLDDDGKTTDLDLVESNLSRYVSDFTYDIGVWTKGLLESNPRFRNIERLASNRDFIERHWFDKDESTELGLFLDQPLLVSIKSENLMRAIDFQSLNCIKRILETFHITNSRYLNTAIIRNKPKIVELILRYGKTDNFHNTLFHAVKNGYNKIAELLLLYKPDLRSQIKLDMCYDNPYLFKTLVLYHDFVVTKFNCEAICSKGCTEILSFLLKRGVEPEELWLAYSVSNNRRETVKILLEDGRVDPDCRSVEALCCVIEKETLELLLDDGRLSFSKRICNDCIVFHSAENLQLLIDRGIVVPTRSDLRLGKNLVVSWNEHSKEVYEVLKRYFKEENNCIIC